MKKTITDKKVVLLEGSDRRELVRTALTTLGNKFTRRIKEAKRIFIHPNLVTHFRKGACTDIEAIRGVVDHISLLRGDKIIVGDAAFHGTKTAFKKLDYESLGRSGNVKLVDLNDDKTVPSFAYASNMKKRPLGFSKTVAASDMNIVVVPAKMHSYYIVSLSIKTHIVGSQVVSRSPFGIYARWPWLHTGYRQAHLSLAEVYAKYPAQLAIIDGTQVMEGQGPAFGKVRNLNWLIASFNPVAADALAAYLMGLEPKEIGYLYHLEKMGFGPIDHRKMEIAGSNPNKLRRTLSRPYSYNEIIQWK